MQILDNDPSVGEEAIKIFEASVEKPLPEDYRKHLLEYNGGRPQPDTFTTLDGEEESDVRVFYKLNSQKESGDLLAAARTFAERMPSELLPIARDSGGNQICLAVSGTNYGKVYFWDHELEAEEDEEPGWDNIKLIANSFSEFLNNLYEFQED